MPGGRCRGAEDQGALAQDAGSSADCKRVGDNETSLTTTCPARAHLRSNFSAFRLRLRQPLLDEWIPASAASRLLAAEQVLRNPRRGKNVVARRLELLAQAIQVDVDELALPLADLARDDHGFDIRPVHQRY